MAKKKHFAKPLPLILRFFTALKITAQIYRPNRLTPTDLLYHLLEEQENDNICPVSKMVATGSAFSQETKHKIKQHFTEIYQDETLIVDWLNKKVNKYYFSRKKNANKNTDEAQKTFETILQQNGVYGLLKNFKP